MASNSLAFRYAYTERVSIRPGESVRLLHDDVDTSDERILHVREQDLVDWIFSDRISRELFFAELGISPSVFRCSIPDREFPESMAARGGDIDFVLLHRGSVSHAVSVEFKKVKVKVFADGGEKVNKLSDIGHLIRQGNERRAQGFHQSYICAAAVIDSHERRTPNVFTKSASCQEMQQFYNLDCLEGIHTDVGIILIEIAQPTGRSYRDLWGFGACMLKSAVPQEQSSRVTADISARVRTYTNLASQG